MWVTDKQNKWGNPIFYMPVEMKTISLRVFLYSSGSELTAWPERYLSAKVKVLQSSNQLASNLSFFEKTE